MLKHLLNRCCWAGCWRRATHKHTEMWGMSGIRMFGRALLEFPECERHWEMTEKHRAENRQRLARLSGRSLENPVAAGELQPLG